MVESRHRAAVAVVDSDGHVALSAGDIDGRVYARSAIKPIQALALIESGAADAFGLGDAEVALACASHSGEPRHVRLVREWLARIGCAVDDLECGGHLPSNAQAAADLLTAGNRPGRVHDNCSGKHTGFLSVARHKGWPTAGYIRFDHPVQQMLLGILEQMTGLDLGDAPRGTDGCGIPQIGIPLGNLALAMARFADPSDQPERRQAACARVRKAMVAEPFLVAGTGRFCTEVMTVTRERALIKTGAEGVYCGALPGLGLGIALKVDDGAGRAASAVMGRLLVRLGILADHEQRALTDVLEPPVMNRAGLEVGRVRISGSCPF